MVTAITGGGFGDEGKGKITDLLAARGYCCAFSGRRERGAYDNQRLREICTAPAAVGRFLPAYGKSCAKEGESTELRPADREEWLGSTAFARDTGVWFRGQRGRL